MPTVEQQLRVIVKADRHGERRKFSIEIDAPEYLFQVSDILTAHGVEKSLDSVLRDRTREIIAEHVMAGKTVLRNLADDRAGRKTAVGHTNIPE